MDRRPLNPIAIVAILAALPLRAAGIADAKVVARFASDPTNDPSYIDRSRSYNEVMAKGP